MANYLDELLNPASAEPQGPVSIPQMQDPQKVAQQRAELDAQADRQIELARQWNAYYENRDGRMARELAQHSDQAASFRAALGYARNLGITPDEALKDPRVAQYLTKEKEIRQIEWRAKHPQLAAMLQDPDFSRAAADDIEMLLRDDSWWTRTKDSFVSAYTSLEAADIGMKRATGSATEWDLLRLKDIEREQQLLQKTDGPLQWIMQQAGRMSYQLPSGIAAAGAGTLVAGPVGATVGFVANTMAWTGYEDFGNKRNELLAADPTLDDASATYGAAVSALLSATLEGAGELLTFKLAKPLFNDLITRGVKESLADQTTKSALVAFGKAYGKEVSSETATELGQLLSSELGTLVAEYKGGKDLGSFQDMAKKVSDTLAQTLVVAGTFGMVPAGIQAATVRAKVQQAQKSKVYMDEMAETDNGSKLIKEAPTEALRYLRTQAERTGVKTLYVSRDEMRLALEEQAKAAAPDLKTAPEREAVIEQMLTALDAKIPGIKEQYNEAQTGEVDLEIDIAQYRASGVSATDLHGVLTKYARFDAGLPSANRAKELQPILDNFTEVLRLSAEHMGENGTPSADAPLKQIRDQFLDALKKVPDSQFPAQAGGTAQDQRAHLATVAAKVFKMLAVRNAEAMPAPKLTDEQKAAGMKAPTQVERLVAILQEAGFDNGMLGAEFVADLQVQEGQVAAEGDGPSARAAYDISRLAVIFTKKTSAKDVLHELGHFWMRAQLALVKAGKASPAVQADVQAMFTFLGVKDMSEWDAMSEKQREKYDEKWAYSVEQHFSEGKAPEPALEGVFAKLGRFMRGIFQSIRDLVNPIYKARFGEDLPALTPEIRKVMDAMLVSDEQVAVAKAQRLISPLFMSRETFLGTDQEWKQLQQDQQASEDDAVMRFFVESMQNSEAAEELREKAMRKLRKLTKEETAKLTERETEALRKERVWRTEAFLLHGVSVDEVTGEATNVGVERVQLDRKQARKMLKAAGVEMNDGALRGLLADKDGQDVEMVAQMLGWDSGVQMLQALGNRGKFDDAVDARVKEAMRTEQPSIGTEEGRETWINAAIHNELRLMFVATELSNWLLHMQIAADAKRDDVQADRAAATEKIGVLQPQRDALRKQLDALNKAKAPDADKAPLREQIAALDKELRPLKKLLVGPVTTPKELMQAARYAAQQAILKTTVGKIAPLKGGKRGSLATQHSKQAGQASMSALQMMKSADDRMDVMRKKQEQLLHETAAAEAVKAEREIAKGRKRMDALAKVSRKDLKNHEWDYIYVARLLLGQFAEYQDAPIETGIDEEMRREAILRVANEDPTLAARVVEIMANPQRSLESLTLEEFRAVQDVLKALRDQGSMIKKATSIAKKETLAELQEQVAERLRVLAPKARIGGQDTNGEKRRHGIFSVLYMGRRFEHWLLGIEGKDGFLAKLLFRPIVNAAYKARIKSSAVREQFGKSILALKLPTGRIRSEKLNYEFGRNEGNGVMEILMVLLNTGNQGNYDRMLTGMGWADMDADGNVVIDPETGRPSDLRFRSAIQDLISDGTLEAKHFKWLQQTWDLLGEQFQIAQRAHIATTGTPMKLVSPESRSWRMKDGESVTLQGGYVPLKYKNVGAAVAEDKATIANEMGAETGTLVPTVQNSWTKERAKDFTAPLRFDEMTLFTHLDAVIRYGHVQQVLMETLRVLGLTSRQQSPVKSVLQSIEGDPLTHMILPWFRDVASQTTTRQGGGPQWLVNGINTLRRNSAMAALFGSIANTAQQITGLFVTTSQLVSKRNMLRAIYRANGPEMKEMRNTEMMRLRMDSQMQEWELQLRNSRSTRNTLQKAQDWTARNVYWMQSKAQNYVDVVTWDAAFYDYMDRPRPADVDEKTWTKQAQDHADSVVRTTQGSFNPEDLSNIERGNVWTKIVAQFTSYFNMLANLNGSEMARIFREAGWQGFIRKDLALQYLWGWFLPIVMSDVIARVFYGDWEDAEEEEDRLALGLDMLMWSQIRSLSAAAPVVGQVLPGWIGSFTSNPLDDRLRLPPLVSFLVERAKAVPKSATDIVTGEANKYDLTNVMTALTLFTGLPLQTAGRPINMIYQSLEDPNIELFTPGAGIGERGLEILDAARFFATGMSSPQQER